ncbi:hypothetical protein KM043_003933 [Ampulex compressa]|nr:hypothetical protein KM043_003933 [Ampulex compressa]
MRLRFEQADRFLHISEGRTRGARRHGQAGKSRGERAKEDRKDPAKYATSPAKNPSCDGLDSNISGRSAERNFESSTFVRKYPVGPARRKRRWQPSRPPHNPNFKHVFGSPTVYDAIYMARGRDTPHRRYPSRWKEAEMRG